MIRPMGLDQFKDQVKDKFEKNIEEGGKNINLQYETDELKKLIELNKNLKENTDTTLNEKIINKLGEQSIKDKEGKEIMKISELFGELKKCFEPFKDSFDKTSSEAEKQDLVSNFVKSVDNTLKTCGLQNRTDAIAILQVYINQFNKNNNNQFAEIPYSATMKGAEYTKGSKVPVFIDGILGPHTYKSLWNNFAPPSPGGGDNIPTEMFTRKPKQYFGNKEREGRIINTDILGGAVTIPSAKELNTLFENMENPQTEKEKQLQKIVSDPVISQKLNLINIVVNALSTHSEHHKVVMEFNKKIRDLLDKASNETSWPSAYGMVSGQMEIFAQRFAGEIGSHAPTDSDINIIGKTLKNFFNLPKESFITNKGNNEIILLNKLRNTFDDTNISDFVATYLAEENITITGKTKDEILKEAEKNETEELRDIERKTSSQRDKTAEEQRKNLVSELKKNNDFQKMNEGDQSKIINEKMKESKEIYLIRMKEIYLSKKYMDEYVKLNPTGGRSRLKDNLDKALGKKQQPQDPMLGEKLKLYDDIQGLTGTHEMFNFSDKTNVWIKEISFMVAEQAVLLAVSGGVLNLVKLGINATRLAVIGNRLAKIPRIGKYLTKGSLLARGAGVVGEGIVFYETANTLQNFSRKIFHGQNVSYFEGRNNLSEIAKTTLMVGGMRMFSGLIAKQSFKTRFGNKKIKNPLNYLETKARDSIPKQALKITTESVVGGYMLYNIEGYGEIMIDPEANRTGEELYQSIVMYAALRMTGKAGKYLMTKLNGKPSLKALPQGKIPKALTQGKPPQAIEGRKTLTEGDPKLTTKPSTFLEKLDIEQKLSDGKIPKALTQGKTPKAIEGRKALTEGDPKLTTKPSTFLEKLDIEQKLRDGKTPKEIEQGIKKDIDKLPTSELNGMKTAIKKHISSIEGKNHEASNMSKKISDLEAKLSKIDPNNTTEITSLQKKIKTLQEKVPLYDNDVKSKELYQKLLKQVETRIQSASSNTSFNAEGYINRQTGKLENAID